MKIFEPTIPKQGLSLKANFSWTLVGNIVYRFSQWGLVVILAKLTSPESVGQYTLALAITTPVYMFCNLGLTVVQTTDADDHNIFGEYLGLRIITSLFALVFIAGILILGPYESYMISVLAIVSLTKYVESISDAAHGLMQKQEHLDLVAQSLIIRGVASLLTFLTLLYFFRNLVAALAIQIIVWGGILLTYDLRNVHHWQSIKPRFELSTMLKLFWLALPLGIVAGLGSLSVQVPRYMLEYLRSTHELGIFAAIASLGMIASLITTALSRSALPRFAQLFANGAFGQFKRLLFKLMGLGILIAVMGAVGTAIFGKAFLTIAYTEEYARHSEVLIVVMANVGLIATFSFLGTALSATQQFVVQVPIHIVKILVVVIFSYLLIPYFGILGAAWAMLISSLTSGLIYGFIFWRTIRRSQYEL